MLPNCGFDPKAGKYLNAKSLKILVGKEGLEPSKP
jgi:hypothetical protein